MGKPYFQYQKGAIKTVWARSLATAATNFQYQKGAIKTNVPPIAAAPNGEVFQYQKGAIKTL